MHSYVILAVAVLSFGAFLAVELRPALRKNLLVTVLQVVGLSVLFGHLFAKTLELSEMSQWVVESVVFVVTLLVFKYGRDQLSV